MATKIEKLFQRVHDQQWEYAKSRYINDYEFNVKDNMGEKMGDLFIGIVKNKDARDRFILEYTCPVSKHINESGRVISVELEYDKQEWSLLMKEKE